MKTVTVRLQVHALRIFGETVIFGENVVVRGADPARDRRILGKPPRLDQHFERAIAPAAGRNLIIASLLTLGVEDRANVQIVEQSAPRNVVSKVRNSLVRPHAPDIGRRQAEPVEGYVARGTQGDFGLQSGHVLSPLQAATRLSLGSEPAAKRRPHSPSRRTEAL